MDENQLANIVWNKSLEIHRALGPGLLESAYEKCLYFELIEAGLKVERQKTLPISYKGKLIDTGFRIDLMIEKS